MPLEEQILSLDDISAWVTFANKKLRMIQRIQSLFFLVASVIFIGLYAVPFASSSKAFGDVYQNLTLDIKDNIGLLGMVILGGVLSLTAIFLFRNRKLQSTLGYIVIIIGIGLSCFAYYLYSTVTPDTNEAITSLGMGIAMPLIASVMALVGNIFIKKDEKLVKSMDRLR